MQFPKIDLSSLPDLPVLTAVFGAERVSEPGHNDTIIVLATVLYEAQSSVQSFF